MGPHNRGVGHLVAKIVADLLSTVASEGKVKLYDLEKKLRLCVGEGGASTSFRASRHHSLISDFMHTTFGRVREGGA